MERARSPGRMPDPARYNDTGIAINRNLYPFTWYHSGYKTRKNGTGVFVGIYHVFRLRIRSILSSSTGSYITESRSLNSFISTNITVPI